MEGHFHLGFFVTLCLYVPMYINTDHVPQGVEQKGHHVAERVRSNNPSVNPTEVRIDDKEGTFHLAIIRSVRPSMQSAIAGQ